MYTHTKKITSKVKLYPLFLPKFRTLTTFKQNEDVSNCIKAQQTIKICPYCNKYIFNCYCGLDEELISVSEDFKYRSQAKHSRTMIKKKPNYICSLCNRIVCSCDDVKYEHPSQLEEEEEEYLYNRKEDIKEY